MRMRKGLRAGVLTTMALGGSGAVAQGTVDLGDCSESCQLSLIEDARSIVFAYQHLPLTQDQSGALRDAVERGVHVRLYTANQDDPHLEALQQVMKTEYEEWSRTAPETDVSLLGMGACVMPVSRATSTFLITDPWGWSDEDRPAHVDTMTDHLTTDREAVRAASEIVETEEFIQCFLP